MLTAAALVACLGWSTVARADREVRQPRPLPTLDAKALERNVTVRFLGASIGAAGGVALGAGGLLMRYHDNLDVGPLTMLGGLALAAIGVGMGTGASIRFHRHRIAVGEEPRRPNRSHRWLVSVGWGLLHLGVTAVALTMTQAAFGPYGFENEAAGIAGITTGAALMLGSVLVLFAGYVRRRTARRAKVTLQLSNSGTPWSGGLCVQW